MEDVVNGNSKDEQVHQKLDVEEEGIKDLLDDETLRMCSVVAEGSFEVTVTKDLVGNGKQEKGLDPSFSSSSSSDEEETEVVVTENTDETSFPTSAENGVSDLIVEKETGEVESSPVIELQVVEVIEEHISEAVEETADEAKGSAEEEKEVIITEESQTVEAVEVELADPVPDQVESAEEVLSTTVLEAKYADQEGTYGALHHIKEEDSFLANAKSSYDADYNRNKAELPDTNGNSIISVSARTMQPTSWRGCCGLLEVFKRGDG